jgi:hypothetical protein
MERSVCTFCTFAQTALLAAAVFAVPLAAQLSGSAGQRPVRIGFGGGVTVPVGDVDETWKTGLNGQVFLLISRGFLPPIRLNLGYERFDLKEAVLGSVTGESNIGRIDGLVEGRVQNVYTEAGVIDTETIRYVPLTFGILF